MLEGATTSQKVSGGPPCTKAGQTDWETEQLSDHSVKDPKAVVWEGCIAPRPPILPWLLYWMGGQVSLQTGPRVPVCLMPVDTQGTVATLTNCVSRPSCPTPGLELWCSLHPRPSPCTFHLLLRCEILSTQTSRFIQTSQRAALPKPPLEPPPLVRFLP